MKDEWSVVDDANIKTETPHVTVRFIRQKLTFIFDQMCELSYTVLPMNLTPLLWKAIPEWLVNNSGMFSKQRTFHSYVCDASKWTTVWESLPQLAAYTENVATAVLEYVRLAVSSNRTKCRLRLSPLYIIGGISPDCKHKYWKKTFNANKSDATFSS